MTASAALVRSVWSTKRSVSESSTLKPEPRFISSHKRCFVRVDCFRESFVYSRLSSGSKFWNIPATPVGSSGNLTLVFVLLMRFSNQPQRVPGGVWTKDLVSSSNLMSVCSLVTWNE